MRWDSSIPVPLTLTDGRKLVTLADVRDFIALLPEMHQRHPYWEHATDLLYEAAHTGKNNDIGEARRYVSRALKAEGLLPSLEEATSSAPQAE
jgi:hypothetical protein